MANVTLAAIRAEAEKKFGNLTITLESGNEVVLTNPLRLSKDARAILGKSADEDADAQEVLVARLRAAAKEPALVDELVAEVDGDLTVIMAIFEEYAKVSQVGEA